MGPAGLMAGSILLKQGFEVHFFDHKKSAGRKFLVAGNGGFNLTHSEKLDFFLEKYTHSFLQSAVQQFDNNAWINFLEKIGIQTFVGSSGKVFPIKGIKPIEVLTKWLEEIKRMGGIFHFSHKFIDFNEKEVTFRVNEKSINRSFDYLILAMGGSSWKKTGSTGEWKDLFQLKGIKCEPFESSNSGFEFENWEMMADLESRTMKNIEVSFGSTYKKGDIVISKYGLEGTPIYFVNKAYRDNKQEFLKIDFKPTKSLNEIQDVLTKSKNVTEGLKSLNLSKTMIQFIKIRTTKEEFSSPEILSETIKGMKLFPNSLRPIDEVISTIGGVSMDSITSKFKLINYQNIFVCGEMLNWDAPTGGYLIQGCVSSGFVVGNEITKHGK